MPWASRPTSLPQDFCHVFWYFGFLTRWRYSMSSPVSSFKTAAKTSLGKRRVAKTRTDNGFCRSSQQDNIECWAPEVVRLRVRVAGPSLYTGSAVLLRVCIAGPSSCGGWSFWRRRVQRAASRLSLSTRHALRAARRVVRVAACRGPWDCCVDPRRKTAGVKGLHSVAGRGSTCWGAGVVSSGRATLGGGVGERGGRWIGGRQSASLGPATSTVGGAMI